MRKYALAAALLLAAACGSDDDQTPDSHRVVLTLHDAGITPARFAIHSHETFLVVNADGRPHQLVSSDCPELSTGVLEPGDEIEIQVGGEEAVCHIQDLIPSSTQRAIQQPTVQVEIEIEPT